VRFDPRLISEADAPLDASGEIDLPDDLLEMAAQLGDDAAFLAARYPAPSLAVPVKEVMAENVYAARRLRSRGWFVAMLGGGVAAAALVAMTIVTQPTNEQAVATPAVVESAVNEVAVRETRPAVETSVSTTARSRPRIERLPWAPSAAIGEVSGPELEGLLDLWQSDEQPAETRIEI
jgi:hypothetical protein